MFTTAIGGLSHNPARTYFRSGDGPGAGGGPPQGGSPQGGAPQGGSPQGGGGAAPPVAVKIDPNGLYDFGDGKPQKWSDYSAQYVPRSEYDGMTTKFNRGRDLLISEAKKLEQAWGTLQSRLKQGQGQQPGQPQSPLDRFANEPLVDGKMLTEAYQAMREGDLKPLTQLVNAQQQKITKLEQAMQRFGTGVGSIHEQQASQQHEARVNDAIGSLGKGFDAKRYPILRTIADDIYLSHDPADPNLNREFASMLKSRVDELRSLFRELDKAAVEEAKSVKRTFTRPGGNATPNGPSRYQHENGSQLASRLFHPTSAA